MSALAPSSGHGDATRIASARNLAKVAVGALGVVYGDIGTSPLYAIRECFNPVHGMDPNVPNTLGILSLVFWALTLVVVVKYLTFVMRADNQGDGGILALLALVMPQGNGNAGRRRLGLILLGLVGAALLWSDGMITPAITVLGAVEGLEIATPVFRPFVVPIALVILVALFLLQRRGTGKIGAMFGPVMVVWFVAIAALGIPWILREPRVLAGAQPGLGVPFHGRAPMARLPDSRRRHAVHHRSGGALRRHGPLRADSDPDRMVSGRLPRPAAELLRPGGASPGPGRGRGREPVLPAGAAPTRSPAGRALDRRGGHRLPGADHRGVLARPAGGAARLLAATHDRAHLASDPRPDLRPRDQHRLDGRLPRAHAGVSEVDQPGCGIRHVGGGHDGRHLGAALRGRPPKVGLEPLAGGRAHRFLPRGGPVLPGRQPHQDQGRRVVPAGGRGR